MTQFIRALSIDADGVIVWEANNEEGNTRNVLEAKEMENLPMMNYVGIGVYFAPMVRLITGFNGHVFAKALYRLKDAMVLERHGYESAFEEHFKIAAPGEFAIGQIAYFVNYANNLGDHDSVDLVLVKGVNVSSSYSGLNRPKQVIEYEVRCLRHEGTMTVKEADLSLLPNNAFIGMLAPGFGKLDSRYNVRYVAGVEDLMAEAA